MRLRSPACCLAGGIVEMVVAQACSGGGDEVKFKLAKLVLCLPLSLSLSPGVIYMK